VWRMKVAEAADTKEHSKAAPASHGNVDDYWTMPACYQGNAENTVLIVSETSSSPLPARYSSYQLL